MRVGGCVCRQQRPDASPRVTSPPSPRMTGAGVCANYAATGDQRSVACTIAGVLAGQACACPLCVRHCPRHSAPTHGAPLALTLTAPTPRALAGILGSHTRGRARSRADQAGQHHAPQHTLVGSRACAPASAASERWHVRRPGRRVHRGHNNQPCGSFGRHGACAMCCAQVWR